MGKEFRKSFEEDLEERNRHPLMPKLKYLRNNGIVHILLQKHYGLFGVIYHEILSQIFLKMAGNVNKRINKDIMK